MQAQVSVILPFHNNEVFLAEAIESILNQTFSNFELILIDNNSTDSSIDIATKFASEDDRIIIVDEPRVGSIYALNKGIKSATTPLIACMDVFDISYAQRLEKQICHLNENADIGLVACQANYIKLSEDSDNQESQSYFIQCNNQLITNSDISHNCFVESPLIHSTVMFRKTLIDNFGSYRLGDFPEDYELWLRWILNGVKMYKLPEHLVEWTDVPLRLSSKNEKINDQALYEVKSKYMLDWLKANNAFMPDVVVWGAGRQSRQRFNMLHELGIQPKYFIDLRANPARNVIEFQKIPPAGKTFILSYVSNRSARENNKRFLVELGYTEGKDFICMA